MRDKMQQMRSSQALRYHLSADSDIEFALLEKLQNRSFSAFCSFTYKKRTRGWTITCDCCGMSSLAQQEQPLANPLLQQLLDALEQVVSLCLQEGLPLCNVQTDFSCIFMQGDKIYFVYLPLRAETDLTAEQFLYAVLERLADHNRQIRVVLSDLQNGCAATTALQRFEIALKKERAKTDVETVPLSPSMSKTDVQSAETTWLVAPPPTDFPVTMKLPNMKNSVQKEFEQATDRHPDNETVPLAQTTNASTASDETTLLSVAEFLEYTQQPEVSACLLRISTGERISLNKTPFILGKDPRTADYIVADNPAVSRRHAEIIWKDSSFWVRDQNSTNGTQLEGRLLPPEAETELDSGDLLTIGNENFQFFLQ